MRARMMARGDRWWVGAESGTGIAVAKAGRSKRGIEEGYAHAEMKPRMRRVSRAGRGFRPEPPCRDDRFGGLYVSRGTFGAGASAQ
jgi:hypothetical protein